MPDAPDQSPLPLPLPLAVVVYDGDFDIGGFLAEACDRLAARGDLVLGGVVPKNGGFHANGRHEMLLEDVASGETTLISQELGAGADGCILDTDGLTHARIAISEAIGRGVDLVVVGKFSKQEAAGHGVRDEIAEALGAGIPTLLAMRERHRDAWGAFAGPDWVELPRDVDAVVAWARATTGRDA